MKKGDYPKQRSNVTVTFTDGEIKVYSVSAGAGIAGYLAREASSSGILTLLDGARAYSIPLTSVREWTIETSETAGDG